MRNLLQKLKQNFLGNGVPLWTPDYIKLTIGSVVSYLGNAAVNFILGLFILEETGEVMLYALYLIFSNVAQVLVPLLIGTLLDRVSRIKTIYTMDFISTGLFLLIYVSSKLNFLSMPLLFLISFAVGVIKSIYQVAMSALHPTMVAPENLTKAYSIQEILEIMGLIAVPLATILYYATKPNIAPMFLVFAAFFLTAAIVETTIHTNEKQLSRTDATNSVRFGTFVRDFADGVKTFSRNKALMTVLIISVLRQLMVGAQNTGWLPFFRDYSANYGYYLYIAATSCYTSGRFMGNSVLFFLQIPPKKKFLWVSVCLLLSYVFDAVSLLLPLIPLFITQYLVGMTSAVDYNSRVSCTNYILPDDQKGRWNGVLNMMANLGVIVGELVCGSLADYVPIPLILFGMSMFSALVVLVLYGFVTRKEMQELYSVSLK